MHPLPAVLLLLQAVPDARLARAEIVFDAKATVADFKGRATDASGALVGGAVLADARGWVEIPWRAIDTGNGTRNRHMLKTVDVEQFPSIRFDLVGVVADTSPQDSLGVQLRGTLALHGVTREVEWPAVVRIYAETVTVHGDSAAVPIDSGSPPRLETVRVDSVSIQAAFPVDMREYGIKPPVRLVIARMGPVVQVRVKLVFTILEREAGDGKREAPDSATAASPLPPPDSR